MKRKNLQRSAAALLAGLCLLFLAPDLIAGSPPRVVKIVPENRARNVDPNLEKILITFSEPMVDQSWSVCGGGEHYPEIKSIRYTKNCTVLEIRVKLKRGWTYRFWLNSPSYKNFISQKGVPLEPMEVTFETAGKARKKKKESGKIELESLGTIDFDLADDTGFRVRSQDYAGVPLFIAFGAAW